MLFYPGSGIAATLVQRKWGNILFKNSQVLLQFLATQQFLCSVYIVKKRYADKISFRTLSNYSLLIIAIVCLHALFRFGACMFLFYYLYIAAHCCCIVYGYPTILKRISIIYCLIKQDG